VADERTKYLIAGREGQLARAFIGVLERRGLDYLAPAENDLDIADADGVQRCLAAFRPQVVINCAAYNLVDLAEQEKDTAFRVNAEGPRILARAASACGARLVHFGSDYAFDGLKENGLYCEQDKTAPLSEYGKSKVLGEQMVLREDREHLVLRLSWVYGRGKQNFISKLLQWSKSQEFLKVACDEFSVPTSAYTVVEVTLRALALRLSGIYHLTNTGYCSRYEWARLILDTLGIKKFVRPVSMDIFALPARRPKFSAMSSAAIAEKLGVTIPTWQQGIVTFLQDNGVFNE
jgi:dTDP-4-dehydrorhamnose reductase